MSIVVILEDIVQGRDNTMVLVVTEKYILRKGKDRQRERNSKKSVCDISSTINHNSCRCKNQPEKKFNSVDLSGC